MKVVIPVAGQGTRLKPHTLTIPKVLIQVAGKPILGHILDEIKKLKLQDLILVVGDMAEKIQEYVDKKYNFKVKYVHQEKPQGLGHAIYLASKYFEEEPVLIILGDTIFKVNLKKVISGKYSSLGVKAVDNPRRFGTVKVENDYVVQLQEKKENPSSNLAIVGIYYLINSRLLKKSLEKIIRTNKRTAGEYQLTDALQEMVEQGEKMKIFEVDGWYDCGKPETLLSTNKTLLNNTKSKSSVCPPSVVIVNPVYISPDASIENSIIGPHTSVAGGGRIKNSIIKNSIINENATVENVLLNFSIIGENAHIVGRFDKINLGDWSVIDLGYQEDIDNRR